MPPTLETDCRVIDSDNDRAAGFTVQFMGGTNNRSRTRIRDTSQLLMGVVAPDGRHSAQYAAGLETYQLSCEREPCTRSPAQVCSLGDNPARFLPLPARASEWTCADVIDQVEKSGNIGLGPIAASGR